MMDLCMYRERAVAARLLTLVNEGNVSEASGASRAGKATSRYDFFKANCSGYKVQGTKVKFELTGKGIS